MNGLFFKTKGKSSRQAWLIVGIGVVIALLSSLIAPYYYRWILNHQNKVTLQILCDTSELDPKNLTVFLLYDKAALHPLAKVFGLLQLRDPETVTSFYPITANNIKFTRYSITITNVPPHPLVRIQIVSGDKKFFTLVRDRRIFENTLTVRPIANSNFNN